MDVLAYCFMPDHAHLLVLSTGSSSVVDLMRDFKQLTGFEFMKRTGRKLWQKSYHDQISCSEESFLGSARYIAANPVRAGLVTRLGDWPWLGSFVWERTALVEG
jgi:REP element-mobilizing transposase RayT